VVVYFRYGGQRFAAKWIKQGEAMNSKAVVRNSGNISIVDLSGRIVIGEDAHVVRDTVKGLVATGTKSIVLNLKDVTYIDSAGLGELVGAYTTVTNGGGKICLLNTQAKVKDLLQITKLYTVFQSFDNEAEALASFA
jgi:anti-sigma B factor antagonist